MKDGSKIARLEKKIRAEIKKGCAACNSLGAYHCAYPNECGSFDKLIELEKLYEQGKQKS